MIYRISILLKLPNDSLLPNTIFKTENTKRKIKSASKSEGKKKVSSREKNIKDQK